MAASSGLSRSALTYSTELPFLDELFTQLKSGPGKALESSTLGDLARLLAQFMETALERGQADRIEKILEFQEVLHSQLGASMMDPDSVEVIPYTRLPARDPSPPRIQGARIFESVASSVDCPICFDSFAPAEMVTLNMCGEHGYCRPCLANHLGSLISDAEVSKITCPAPGCAAEVHEREVYELVDDEVYQKYLHFLVLAVLKEEKNSRWCTNPKCAMPIIWSPNERVVTCPACNSQFCFDCSRPLHPGYSCEGQPLPDYEAEFQKWLADKKALVKKCPGCDASLEKNDGCNHMTCRCGAQWCWLCRERMETGGHFGETSSPCYGFQFVAFNTREEAVAARDERERTEREQREREQREQEERERAERERAERLERERQERLQSASAESSARLGVERIREVQAGPVCRFCNHQFPSWSTLFTHMGIGGCAPAASSTRSFFAR